MIIIGFHILTTVAVTALLNYLMVASECSVVPCVLCCMAGKLALLLFCSCWLAAHQQRVIRLQSGWAFFLCFTFFCLRRKWQKHGFYTMLKQQNKQQTTKVVFTICFCCTEVAKTISCRFTELKHLMNIWFIAIFPTFNTDLMCDVCFFPSGHTDQYICHLQVSLFPLVGLFFLPFVWMFVCIFNSCKHCFYIEILNGWLAFELQEYIKTK